MQKLHLYEFSAKGRALGAVVLVAAFNRTRAEELAKDWLIEQDLDPNTMRLCRDGEILHKSAILYAWDGDY